MVNKVNVNISLFNKDILISCDEDEREILQQSQTLIQEETDKLSKEVPATHLNAVVSLNIARKLIEANKKSQELDTIQKSAVEFEGEIATELSTLSRNIEK